MKVPSVGENTVISVCQSRSKNMIVCWGIKFLPTIFITLVSLSQAGMNYGSIDSINGSGYSLMVMLLENETLVSTATS